MFKCGDYKYARTQLLISLISFVLERQISEVQL